MIIYHVRDFGEIDEYYLTKASAMKAADQQAQWMRDNGYGGTVVVDKHETIKPDRWAVCCMLNGDEWSVSRTRLVEHTVKHMPRKEEVS